jgi:ammonium transporter, Amt family
VGGTLGAILTGVFATGAVNPILGKGPDGNPLPVGLLDGNAGQVLTQIIAVLITYALAGVGTFVILKILDATIGLRVNPEVEYQGVDINEHGEEAYGEELAAGFTMSRVE